MVQCTVDSGNSAGSCRPCGPGYADKVWTSVSDVWILQRLKRNAKCEMWYFIERFCNIYCLESNIMLFMPLGKDRHQSIFWNIWRCKKRIQSLEVCQEAARELELFDTFAARKNDYSPTGCNYIFDAPSLRIMADPWRNNVAHSTRVFVSLIHRVFKTFTVTNWDCRVYAGKALNLVFRGMLLCYYRSGYAVEYWNIKSSNQKDIAAGCTMKTTFWVFGKLLC